MSVFFSVAKNTLRECLREPIFFILLVSAVMLIGLFPSLSLFVFREQIKLVVDSSMATTMVFGLFAAVVCAGNTISREMSNGTALLLLSKPVPRWLFVVAKIAGISAALGIFVLLSSTATLVSIRVAKDQFQLDYIALYSFYGLLLAAFAYGAMRNYFSSKSFGSEATMAMLVLFMAYCILLHLLKRDLSPENTIELRLIAPALVLILFAVWSMGAITIAFSTRMGIMPNMLACSALFLLGLVSDYYFAAKASGSVMYSILYAAVPNWQLFWLADALASRKAIPISYVLWAGVYLALYMGFCSFFASIMFSGREVEGEG